MMHEPRAAVEALGAEPQAKSRVLEMLLCCSLFWAPFSALRFWKIGPSEFFLLLFLLFFLWHRPRIFKLAPDLLLAKFWLLFLGLASVGAMVNYFVYQGFSASLQSSSLDFMAYASVFLAVSAIALAHAAYGLDVGWILRKLFFAQSGFISLLYLLSQSYSQLLGYSLRNEWGDFSPLASNYHHLGMALVPLPFLGLWLLQFERARSRKLLICSLIIFDIGVGTVLATKTVSLAILGCALFLVGYRIFSQMSRPARQLCLLFGCGLVLITALLFYEPLQLAFWTFFQKEDGGGQRLLIWSTILAKLPYSPLFGLGPGSHGPIFSGIHFDAHQTFITVLIQGGILAFTLYVCLLLDLLKRQKLNPYFICIILGLLFYGLGTDIMRRLPIWELWALCYCNAQRSAV